MFKHGRRQRAPREQPSCVIRPCATRADPFHTSAVGEHCVVVRSGSIAHFIVNAGWGSGTVGETARETQLETVRDTVGDDGEGGGARQSETQREAHPG
jgi:hypothetical protein